MLGDIWNKITSVSFWTGKGDDNNSIELNETEVDSAFGRINDVGSTIENSRNKTVSAMSTLKAACANVEGVNINEHQFDGYYDGLDENVKNIGSLLNSNANDIKAYSAGEANPLITGAATIGMAGTKFLEGFGGAFEDVGDGLLSIGGALCGLVGATDAQDAIAGIVAKDHVKDFFHNVRETTGINQYSAFTEDSALATLFELGGNVGGYVFMGGAVSGLAKGASLFKGTGVLSKVGSALQRTTISNTAIATVGGTGIGTSEGLKEGKNLNQALVENGLGEGLKEGALMFVGGKAAEGLHKHSAVKAATKNLEKATSEEALASKELKSAEDAVSKSQAKVEEAEKAVSDSKAKIEETKAKAIDKRNEIRQEKGKLNQEQQELKEKLKTATKESEKEELSKRIKEIDSKKEKLSNKHSAETNEVKAANEERKAAEKALEKAKREHEASLVEKATKEEVVAKRTKSKEVAETEQKAVKDSKWKEYDAFDDGLTKKGEAVGQKAKEVVNSRRAERALNKAESEGINASEKAVAKAEAAAKYKADRAFDKATSTATKAQSKLDKYSSKAGMHEVKAQKARTPFGEWNHTRKANNYTEKANKIQPRLDEEISGLQTKLEDAQAGLVKKYSSHGKTIENQFNFNINKAGGVVAAAGITGLPSVVARVGEAAASRGGEMASRVGRAATIGEEASSRGVSATSRGERASTRARSKGKTEEIEVPKGKFDGGKNPESSVADIELKSKSKPVEEANSTVEPKAENSIGLSEAELGSTKSGLDIEQVYGNDKELQRLLTEHDHVRGKVPEEEIKLESEIAARKEQLQKMTDSDYVYIRKEAGKPKDAVRINSEEDIPENLRGAIKVKNGKLELDCAEGTQHVPLGSVIGYETSEKTASGINTWHIRNAATNLIERDGRFYTNDTVLRAARVGDDLPDFVKGKDIRRNADGSWTIKTKSGESTGYPGESYFVEHIDSDGGRSVNILTKSERSYGAYNLCDKDGNIVGKMTDIDPYKPEVSKVEEATGLSVEEELHSSRLSESLARFRNNVKSNPVSTFRNRIHDTKPTRKSSIEPGTKAIRKKYDKEVDWKAYDKERLEARTKYQQANQEAQTRYNDKVIEAEEKHLQAMEAAREKYGKDVDWKAFDKAIAEAKAKASVGESSSYVPGKKAIQEKYGKDVDWEAYEKEVIQEKAKYKQAWQEAKANLEREIAEANTRYETAEKAAREKYGKDVNWDEYDKAKDAGYYVSKEPTAAQKFIGKEMESAQGKRLDALQELKKANKERRQAQKELEEAEKALKKARSNKEDEAVINDCKDKVTQAEEKLNSAKETAKTKLDEYNRANDAVNDLTKSSYPEHAAGLLRSSRGVAVKQSMPYVNNDQSQQVEELVDSDAIESDADAIENESERTEEENTNTENAKKEENNTSSKTASTTTRRGGGGGGGGGSPSNGSVAKAPKLKKVKTEEAKKDTEQKASQAKADAKTEEKKEDVKQEDIKQEDVKQEEVKQEEAKQEEVNQEEKPVEITTPPSTSPEPQAQSAGDNQAIDSSYTQSYDAPSYTEPTPEENPVEPNENPASTEEEEVEVEPTDEEVFDDGEDYVTKLPESLDNQVVTPSRKSSGSAVVPIIAGASAAAAAGIGAKAYIDRKNNNYNDEDSDDWSDEDDEEWSEDSKDDYYDDSSDNSYEKDSVDEELDDNTDYTNIEVQKYSAKNSEELSDLQ